MGNRHSNILHSHLVNRATCISCLWHPLPDILKMKMSIYVKPTLIKWFCVWHEAKCAAECHRDWNGDANDATLDINNNRFTIGRSRLLESCVLPAQPTENCEWRAEIKQKYLQFCCLLLLPHSAAILLLTQCLSYSPAWKLKKVWQLAAHVNISLIADHRSTGCPRTKNLSPLSLSLGAAPLLPAAKSPWCTCETTWNIYTYIFIPVLLQCTHCEWAKAKSRCSRS